MNDPTLNRPMFQQTPSATSSLMPATGIGGMTTPDQNAQALRNMFSPQAFRGGGEVINGVKHFEGGGENFVPDIYRQGDARPVPPQQDPGASTAQEAAPPPAPPAPSSAPDTSALGAVPTGIRQLVDRKPAAPTQSSNVPVQREIETSEAGQRAMAKISAGRLSKNPKMVQEGFSELQAITDETYARNNIPPASNEEANRLRAAGIETLKDSVAPISPEAMAAMEDRDRRDVTRPGGMFSIGAPPAAAPPAAPAVPPPNKKDEPIATNIETIRARREASDKQREENKWMGLLAAGLGMMASKSRTAAGGIGEGGLQGLQTFAGLEKARREDEANLRREDYQQQQLALQNKQFGLSEQQLAQQKQIAMAQLEKDPDTVRLYRALGGGNLMEGYRLASSDATLKSAQLIAADPMADEASKTQARAYLNSRIAEASGARAGGGQLPPVRLISK